MLIKKEIPGPDTVDEFLYEVNALSRLHSSHHVIELYGVVVDDSEREIKGLLISYAEQGALIDIIYDSEHSLPWSTREKWARQIVQGLADIHEAGFVQGDFTLSNIVIDSDDNAKIIDINRRGCPVGWEPPEATPLIESNQRISMYIGVKSDLYQLGMVLWALATQEDEPERHGRPLVIDDDVEVPDWYRTVVETCLAEDPRLRAQAGQLLHMFPPPDAPDGHSQHDYFADGFQNGLPRIRTMGPPADWSYGALGHTYVDTATGLSNEPYYYPTRGRSPPSPMPSNRDCDSPDRTPGWQGLHYNAGQHFASISDIGPAGREAARSRSVSTGTSTESLHSRSAANRAKDGDGDTLQPTVEPPNGTHQDIEHAAPNEVSPTPALAEETAEPKLDEMGHDPAPANSGEHPVGVEGGEATDARISAASPIQSAEPAGNTEPAALTDSIKAEAATTTACQEASTVDAQDGPQSGSASKGIDEPKADMPTETTIPTPSSASPKAPEDLAWMGAHLHGNGPNDDDAHAQMALRLEADLEQLDTGTTPTIDEDEPK